MGGKGSRGNGRESKVVHEFSGVVLRQLELPADLEQGAACLAAVQEARLDHEPAGQAEQFDVVVAIKRHFQHEPQRFFHEVIETDRCNAAEAEKLRHEHAVGAALRHVGKRVWKTAKGDALIGRAPALVEKNAHSLVRLGVEGKGEVTVVHLQAGRAGEFNVQGGRIDVLEDGLLAERVGDALGSGGDVVAEKVIKVASELAAFNHDTQTLQCGRLGG